MSYQSTSNGPSFVDSNLDKWAPTSTSVFYRSSRAPHLPTLAFHVLSLFLFIVWLFLFALPFNTQCSNATYVRGPAACMCACRTKCMMWMRAATASIREHLYRAKIRWRLTWWSPTFSLYLFFLRSQLWWLLPLMPSVKMVWNKTERLVCGTKDSRYPRMRYEISSAVGREEEKKSFVTCRQGLLVGPNNVGHYHRTHEKIVYSFAYQYWMRRDSLRRSSKNWEEKKRAERSGLVSQVNCTFSVINDVDVKKKKKGFFGPQEILAGTRGIHTSFYNIQTTDCLKHSCWPPM